MSAASRRKVLLVPHMGLGDMLVLRGMVAALSDKNDVLVLGFARYRDSLRCLFEDLAGVSLGLMETTDKLASDIRILQRQGYRLLALGEFCPGWDRTAPGWTRRLYEQAHMDPGLMNARFRLPASRADAAAAMLAKVRELAEGRPYVLVHDDPERPLVLPEIADGVCVFHVDDKRFASDIIFDYSDVLRHAHHLHAIDSCFALLAHLGQLGTPTTVHAYARPGTPGDPSYRTTCVLHAPPATARYAAHRLPGDEFGLALRAHFRHFAALQDIMRPTADEWRPCGSYLMGPASMDYDPSMHPKQALLFESARGRRNALEVGVHGGHSLLMILLASPRAHVTCVDICAWAHTARCVAYLQAQFPGRITMLRGCSREVLPLLQDTFDFVHVDGDHSYEGARFDMEQAHRLSAPDTTFIFDDFSGHIARAVADLAPLFEVLRAPSCAWNNCLARRRR